MLNDKLVDLLDRLVANELVSRHPVPFACLTALVLAGAWWTILVFRRHLLQIVCVLLLVVLLVVLVREATSSRPDYKALGAVCVTILVVAVGAQFGQHLLPRLKKLGPLELFDREAPELIERLRDIIGSADSDITEMIGSTSRALKVPPSVSEYTYSRVIALIRYIEFSGVESLSEKSKRRYGDLLLKCSQLALLRQDWWPAKELMERVKGLLGKDFEGFKVAYHLGQACLHGAWETEEPARKRELQQQALYHFCEAVKREPCDFDSHFFLAYVQDDLRMLDLAIENNCAALDRRFRYAPAEYNIVISLIKKEEFGAAASSILAIRPDDERGLETLRDATADKELRPLLEHPDYGAQIRWWLEFHQDPVRFPD
jgi:hypothetical protein